MTNTSTTRRLPSFISQIPAHYTISPSKIRMSMRKPPILSCMLETIHSITYSAAYEHINTSGKKVLFGPGLLSSLGAKTYFAYNVVYLTRVIKARSMGSSVKCPTQYSQPSICADLSKFSIQSPSKYMVNHIWRFIHLLLQVLAARHP